MRPGDIITTQITGAAPHHLIADAGIINHRRTRAGDAYASGQRSPGVGLGMPGVGGPVAADPVGCGAGCGPTDDPGNGSCDERSS
ncbi:(Dimethylallyl)adenosine tRNA methylthiotransferase miaB domain protein [Mycobacterium kansasii 732]|nr:(Dimethylallyl)adenosine tRNA methylthiotransferase miaB domain protein [Mycobacterium kansasii 732]